jgi:hypothetical protein
MISASGDAIRRKALTAIEIARIGIVSAIPMPPIHTMTVASEQACDQERQCGHASQNEQHDESEDS